MLAYYPKVVEMWGCTLRAQMEQDPELARTVNAYIRTLNPVSLSLREALMGGRCVSSLFARQSRTICWRE